MDMPPLIVFVVLPVLAYLLGSVPFALVIGKAHGVDIRKVGSGNVGATNLGRTLGMKYFWQAFLLDAAKGFLPVFVSAMLVKQFNGAAPVGTAALPAWAPLVAGAAAMLGHVFPIYLKFKGGKGVATAFGLVVGLWPLYTVAGLAAGLTFVVVFMAYRYISLGSIISAAAFAFYVWVLGMTDTVPAFRREVLKAGDPMPLVWVAVAFAALIIIKHRSNIARLLKGTEPKWGQKAKPPEGGAK